MESLNIKSESELGESKLYDLNPYGLYPEARNYNEFYEDLDRILIKYTFHIYEKDQSIINLLYLFIQTSCSGKFYRIPLFIVKSTSLGNVILIHKNPSESLAYIAIDGKRI